MKIGYMITCYLGRRRVEHPDYNHDRFLVLKSNLDQLSRVSHSFDEIFFIFNLEERHYGLFKKAVDMISEHPTGIENKGKITIIARENEATSYGAWDFALKETIDDGFDYCLLVEDDYVPYADDIDKKFLSYFQDKDDVIFVCQLYSNQICGMWHCSISNGMINKKAFDSYYRETGEGFNVTHRTNNMGDADHNQIYFLSEFTKRGYKILDINNEYRSPFLEHPFNGNPSRMVYYGKEDGEVLLAPVYPPFF